MNINRTVINILSLEGDNLEVFDILTILVTRPKNQPKANTSGVNSTIFPKIDFVLFMLLI